MAQCISHNMRQTLQHSPSRGCAYRFDQKGLSRLLGRGGRIADTPHPSQYAALLRGLRSKCFSGLRCGFMLPVNLLIDGVIHHPVYHQRRVPQMAPMAIFAQEAGFWSVKLVIWVAEDTNPRMRQRLVQLYGDFGVKVLILTPYQIAGGIVDGEEFMQILRQEVDPIFHQEISRTNQPAAVA